MHWLSGTPPAIHLSVNVQLLHMQVPRIKLTKCALHRQFKMHGGVGEKFLSGLFVVQDKQTGNGFTAALLSTEY